MSKDVNLCELLKGHEGETFYSPVCGKVIFTEISTTSAFPIMTDFINLSSNGKWSDNGEIILFPSKDQRDWNKWAEEQKPEVPKTWNEIKYCNVEVWKTIRHLDYGAVEPILKSILALLKIHQLIEVGYGGNITNKEWENGDIIKHCIVYDPDYKKFVYTDSKAVGKQPIAFHKEEQEREFMSYSENIQLLKDFYTI